MSSINGIAFDITETANARLGGDSLFGAVGNAAANSITALTGLNGVVEVTDAGGISQLISDGTIMIRHEGGRVHAMGDSAITFGLTGNSVTSINNFGDGVAATVEGVLDGISINGNLIDVNGDGNDKIVYKTDGAGHDSLVGIDYVESLGAVAINAVGGAQVVQTSGNGTFNFFGGQSFAISALGAARSNGADVWYTIEDNAVTEVNYLHKKNISINGTASNLKIVANGGNDTIQNSGSNFSISGGKGNDLFIYSGGSAIITDYGTGNDKISFTNAGISDVAINGTDLIFSIGEGNSLKLVGAADEKIAFLADNKITYNYFADHVIMDGTRKAVALTSTATEFNAADFSKLVTIDAADVSTAISITGNSKANKIYASNNGASINGGKGNDTLYGGSGTDIFVYENAQGNDVIVNYAAGDTISLVGATVSDASLKSNGDAILKVGSKKITVKDLDDGEIAISEGGTIKYFSDGAIYNADKTSATLPAKYSSKTAKTFDATVTNIDATATKKKVNLATNSTAGATILGSNGKDTLTGGAGIDYIDGGKGNDYLVGGDGADSLFGDKGRDSIYGNAGADYLSGGKGNDLLWGGDGADTFVYHTGDGTDTIMDYKFDDGDLLMILDKNDTAISEPINRVVSKNGDLTLMLKGGGKLVLKDVEKSSTVNINGTNQTF